VNIKYNSDFDKVDWAEVEGILKSVGMAAKAPDIIRRAFQNSYSCIFAWDNKELIGFGRSISDGEYQAAFYDLAIRPEYQGKGVGAKILKALIDSCPNCNIILYSNIGKEEFYSKYNFRKMKTAMALFQNQNIMIEKGFIE
jgi:GNAT superfamily N-acetyltransferase